MAPKTTKTNNKGKNAKTKAPSINVTTVRPESSLGSGPSGTIPGDSQTTLMRVCVFVSKCGLNRCTN